MKSNNVLAGTIDSWLIYNFSSLKSHVTDYTNASRTMLFNINSLQWDNKIMDYLKIPISILPKVSSSSSYFGNFNYKNVKIQQIVMHVLEKKC